jgi:hypothetical protein
LLRVSSARGASWRRGYQIFPNLSMPSNRRGLYLQPPRPNQDAGGRRPDVSTVVRSIPCVSKVRDLGSHLRLLGITASVEKIRDRQDSKVASSRHCDQRFWRSFNLSSTTALRVAVMITRDLADLLPPLISYPIEEFWPLNIPGLYVKKGSLGPTVQVRTGRPDFDLQPNG